MRFKGTWILLIVCLALGCFIYFYEIKGGEEREKAKENESRFWMLEGSAVEQIKLSPSGNNATEGEPIVAERKGEKGWAIRLPRLLLADSDELNSLADKAAELKFESVLEENAPDPEKYGIDAASFSLKIKAKDAKEYAVLFGDKNPAGNQVYASVPGSNKIYLVSSSSFTAFDQKLEDLRDRSVLKFDQSEVQSLDIRNSKGTIHLVKDENDNWWIEKEGRIAADSPAIRGILNALSLGKIPEFFDEDPGGYVTLGLDKPRVDVSLTYGKDKAIKHLSIGSTKVGLRKKGTKRNLAEEEISSAAKLYIAEDASRQELFFVDKDLVDKLDKSLNDLRNKAIASFQRWDVDTITLENPSGSFSFSKEEGEWYIGKERKKAIFDKVTAILDALGSDATELIDAPRKLSAYGLDTPAVHVILKQGDKVLADSSFGKISEDRIYAQTSGDPAVKAVETDNYEKLTGKEEDFIEPPASPEPESESTEE